VLYNALPNDLMLLDLRLNDIRLHYALVGRAVNTVRDPAMIVFTTGVQGWKGNCIRMYLQMETLMLLYMYVPDFMQLYPSLKLNTQQTALST
jgi:hypothetical protein